MRLHPITTQLYVSARPTARDIPKLHEAGVTDIVCLTPRGTPNEVTEQFAWHYRAIPDGKNVPAEKVSAIVQEVRSLLRSGLTVLLHCNAGRNRSGLIAALVLRDSLACSGYEALDFVRECRPRAVANPAFERYIVEVGKRT